MTAAEGIQVGTCFQCIQAFERLIFNVDHLFLNVAKRGACPNSKT